MYVLRSPEQHSTSAFCWGPEERNRPYGLEAKNRRCLPRSPRLGGATAFFTLPGDDQAVVHSVLLLLADALGHPHEVADLLLAQAEVAVEDAIVELLLEAQHQRVSGALGCGTCTQAAISVAQNSRPGRRHKGPRPRNELLTKNRARGNVAPNKPTCSASRAPACVARAVPALRGGAAPLILRAPPPPCARAACRRRARQQVPRRSSGSSSGTTGACRGGALVCAGRGWRCRGCYRDHLGERMISPGVRRFCSSAGSQVPTIFLCCTRVCSAPRFAAPSALPLAAPCRGCHLEHLV